MPELPEVEFCAQHLRTWGPGRRVRQVYAEDGPPLRDVTAAELADVLVGNQMTAIRRHGKQLFIEWASGHALWCHLGMTGKWVRQPLTEEARKHRRCSFTLDDGYRLDFVDSRKFGRLALRMCHHEAQDGTHTNTGPDALKVAQNGRVLFEIYNHTRQPIKSALMDQKRIAGVGNIYAAEALFGAGIHPSTPANSLDEQAFGVLGDHLVSVMSQSLARETGSEIDYLSFGGKNPFMVYGRADEPCPKCGTPIRRMKHSGRSTFYCAHCQPIS